MFTYTFAKDPVKLGEFDTTYGQTYWAEVTEHLQPVKFNSMSLESFSAGDRITCEERSEKQSSKGTNYYQLKKVRKADGEALASTQSGQSQLDRIEAKIDKLLGNDAVLTNSEEAVAQAQTELGVKKDTIYPVQDDGVNLDDIPF